MDNFSQLYEQCDISVHPYQRQKFYFRCPHEFIWFYWKRWGSLLPYCTCTRYWKGILLHGTLQIIRLWPIGTSEYGNKQGLPCLLKLFIWFYVQDLQIVRTTGLLECWYGLKYFDVKFNDLQKCFINIELNVKGHLMMNISQRKIMYSFNVHDWGRNNPNWNFWPVRRLFHNFDPVKCSARSLLKLILLKYHVSSRW